MPRDPHSGVHYLLRRSTALSEQVNIRHTDMCAAGTSYCAPVRIQELLLALAVPEPSLCTDVRAEKQDNQIADPAARVLDILMSGTWRKGSLDAMRSADVRPRLLALLRRRVMKDEPVQLTLMAFPFKTPNPAKTARRRLPDLAELAAIQRFCALETAIRTVHPPGLELHIIHDGALLAEVFDIEPGDVRRYERYLQGLLLIADASRFVRCHDFLELQRAAGPLPGDVHKTLRREAREWWNSTRSTEAWRTDFARTLGMMNLPMMGWREAVDLLRASRSGALPRRFRALETRVHGAMIEYHIRDELIHRFDPRPVLFPEALHTTTRQRPGRLALWLVRRGRSQLPWHGVGVMDGSRRVVVRPAHEILERPEVRPVHLGHESTPFFYHAGGQEPAAGR